MVGNDIETYLRQLQQALPYVPPISVEALYSLHKAKDYEGVVQLIKQTMNIGVRLRVGWVNSGGLRDAPAWIELPPNMPLFNSNAFREMTITMFIRKSFLDQSTYDQVAIVVAHELSHIVLESIGHPLRREEKAVDLTAMLLGFCALYASGCYKEVLSQNGTSIRKLGYLSQEEVQLANEILGQRQWGTKTKAALRALIVISLVLGSALLCVLGVKKLYHAWQLHQMLLADQVEAQNKLPMRLSDYSTWVATRVEFRTWTYIIDVTMTKNDIDLPALESEARRGVCAGNMRARINDGVSYNYEYRDTSGVLVGRFEIACSL